MQQTIGDYVKSIAPVGARASFDWKDETKTGEIVGYHAGAYVLVTVQLPDGKKVNVHPKLLKVTV